jgi:hypothetical protein
MQSCSICLDDGHEYHANWYVTYCHHIFHANCVKNLHKCPLCRRDILGFYNITNAIKYDASHKSWTYLVLAYFLFLGYVKIQCRSIRATSGHDVMSIHVPISDIIYIAAIYFIFLESYDPKKISGRLKHLIFYVSGSSLFILSQTVELAITCVRNAINETPMDHGVVILQTLTILLSITIMCIDILISDDAKKLYKTAWNEVYKMYLYIRHGKSE